jgi:hypothetical protein
MDATSGALWRKSMIWKLIDTAPKDGQMILVWMDYQRKEDGGSVFAARWYQDENDNDDKVDGKKSMGKSKRPNKEDEKDSMK